VTAVLVDQETPRSKVRLGDYTIEARFNQGRGPAPGSPAVGAADRVAGLFLQLGPDDYVIVGRSMGVYFESATDATQSVGLAVVEEGQYVDGRWVAGRRLNGDETPSGRHSGSPATVTRFRRSGCTATVEGRLTPRKGTATVPSDR